MRFSDVDIDLETLTSMELKDFIRQGIDYINELYKHNEKAYRKIDSIQVVL